jgi:polyketide synthase 12/myxalamid-type polyketide synthase MxaB
MTRAAPTELEREALQALRQLRAHVQALELARDEAQKAQREPIAIVGLACHVPGAAGPEAFWELLRRGGDAVTTIPAERWDARDYAPPGATGTAAVHHAGVIEHVDRFDAEFFGIPGREARLLDPQQRLLLEVVWEALEHAAIPPLGLRGSASGVFLGATTTDYLGLVTRRLPAAELDAYVASGNTLAAAAGRVSYVLGLHGPSISMDTACSSSLVAVDRACRSLRDGECRLALAGGVNLLLAPEYFASLSRWGMLSPDGRCKTFDAAANGYVRSEGCAVVVLKRLSHALADGDRVLALIRGSAVNQDGPSSGLTVPNSLAQAALIRSALAAAGVQPAQVGCVEAHGTGTSLGDPIEVEALATVYGEGRDPARPLWVGAVKSNVGHLEAAAGVTGLVKMVLALQHRQIPPNAHFHTPSPHIPWQRIPVRVPTQLTNWPAIDGRRIGGISAFGFSGTNAHLILEEAPTTPASPDAPSATSHARPVLLTLSARSPQALADLARLHAERIATLPDGALAAHAAAAGAARSHLPWRLAVSGSDGTDLAARLREAAAAPEDAEAATTLPADPQVARGHVGGRTRPGVAFLFTGQGSQHPGMGRALAAAEPVYARALAQCAEVMDPLLPCPLQAALHGEAGEALHLTALAQPALFALQWSLAQLWKSRGVQPAVALGHSVGEFAAAVVAGVLPMEAAARLVVERGRLMQSLPAGGAMAAVFAAEAAVRAALDAAGLPIASQVAIAGINGPDECVLSGEATALEAVLARLGAAGVRHERLTVSHAFHSPLMAPIEAAFTEAAQGLRPAAPVCRIVSTLTGLPADADFGSTGYWRAQLRSPVRFDAALRHALGAPQSGIGAALEIGPHPVLVNLAQRALPQRPVAWLTSLRRGRDEAATFTSALARLYVQGGVDDCSGPEGATWRSRVALPLYPFQRQRYWVDAPGDAPAAHGRAAVHANWVHPLLGERLALATGEVVFRGEAGHRRQRVLRDHCLQGQVPWPGAASVETLVAAARAAQPAAPARAAAPANPAPQAIELSSVRLLAPLVLPEGGSVPIQTVLRPDAEASTLDLFADTGDTAEGGRWLRIATARVAPGTGNPATGASEAHAAFAAFAGAAERCAAAMPATDAYAALAARGATFGPAFRTLREIAVGDGEALGRVALDDADDLAPTTLHPALLDGCMQLGFLAARACGAIDDQATLWVPVGFDRITCWAPARRSLRCLAQVRRSASGEPPRLDLLIRHEDGTDVAWVQGVLLAAVDFAPARDHDALQPAYVIDWTPLPLAATVAAVARRWQVIADDATQGQALQAALRAQGELCDLTPDAQTAARAGGEVVWLVGPAPEPVPTLARAAELVHTCAAAVSPEGAAPGTGVQRLWVVTRGAQALRAREAPEPGAAALWGLLRVAHAEVRALACTLVDLEGGDEAASGVAPAATLTTLLRGTPRRETQLALREGSAWRARLALLPAATEQRFAVPAPGQIDALRVVPHDPGRLAAGQIRIAVRAAGLNFRDLMCVLGTYPGQVDALGAECAGVVDAVGPGVEGFAPGDEVLAFAPGGLATAVVVPAEFAVRKPAAWSFEQAAALPLATMTAAYALEDLAALRAGERVLIHAAAGGVGLAAVQIAQRLGAEVFATAGSEAKRSMLRALGVPHAHDSRSLAFRDEVRAATGGRGVDVVLNSLAGDFIGASLDVLAPGGRFAEMGKHGEAVLRSVRERRPDVRHLVFDVGDDARREPALARRLLSDAVRRIEQGEATLPRFEVHPMSAPHAALRAMAAGRHSGKLVFRQDLRLPAAAVLPHAEASYLVTGGLGHVGLATAEALAARGARHLMLVSRRAASPEALARIDALRAQGAAVRIGAADVCDEAEMHALLDDVRRTMPPLRGVVHGAGVLADAMLARQDRAHFERTLAPKLFGAQLLDRLTAGDTLDFFVVFSGGAAWIGPPGQANYAAANTALEAFAQARHARGRPTLAVAWGRWAGGMAAGLDAAWQAGGVEAVDPAQAFEALFEWLRRPLSSVALLPMQWTRYLPTLGAGPAPSFFEQVDASAATAASTGAPSATAAGMASAPAAASGWAAELQATPADQRATALMRRLETLVRRVVGIAAGRALDPRAPLRELGMDSLMTVELRNAIGSAAGMAFPATLVFDHPTLDALVQHLLEALPGLAPARATAAPGAGAAATHPAQTATPKTPASLGDVQAMSDAEAEAALVRELSIGTS